MYVIGYVLCYIMFTKSIVFGQKEKDVDKCTLATGEIGRCTAVSVCPYAKDLLKQKKNPQVCRYIEKYPIVCCPIPSEQITVVSNRQSGEIAKSKTDEENCTLTTGEVGRCTAISVCPYAKNLLREKKNPQVCRYIEKYPIVCCQINSEQKTVSSERKPGEIAMAKCTEVNSGIRYNILTPRGKPTLSTEYPHMAVIGVGKASNITWLCGGSLISKNFVLTAAHCVNFSKLGAPTFVRFGDLNLLTDEDDDEAQQIAVKRTIPHPNYKKPSRYHDIGLIELESEIRITDYVACACLDTSRQHEETEMIATGYGKTSYNGDASSYLLKIDLDIISNDNCRKSYGINKEEFDKGIVDDLQICAGGSINQDTCQGDSGGPLQVRETRWHDDIYVYNIVGITSFGKPCGITHSPGIYTRVFNYLPWIEENVWPSGL